MSDRPDVVVVGVGVAGFAAALAARRAGASVLVVEAGAGATSLAGAAWDVAPPLHPNEHLAPRHSVAEWIAALARTLPHHPYAQLPDPVALIRQAHAAVLPALGGYHPLDLDGPGMLVATDLGLLRRVATAQREALDLGDGLSGDGVGVVDVGFYPGWDARFIASSLEEIFARRGGDRPVSAVPAPVLQDVGDFARHPHELAALLDDGAMRTRVGEALRAAVASHGVATLLLPPMLGLQSDDAMEQVYTLAGRPVGEALGALAGAQGLRLERRVRAALSKAGVPVRYGPVVRIRSDGAAVRVELAEADGLVAGAAVLATGKHVGGGLVVHSGIAREPLADLPVRSGGHIGPMASSADGPDPVERFGTDWMKGGPGFLEGVGYDSQLRGLDARGAPALPGLFVAGALLDGFDPARDGTGLGCCATTGFVAGGNAAAHAGHAG